MISLRALWSWLVVGVEEARLDRAWLANTERLAEYERFTANQCHSCVTKDTAHYRREAFWQRQAEQHAQSVVKAYETASVVRAQFGGKKSA